MHHRTLRLALAAPAVMLASAWVVRAEVMDNLINRDFSTNAYYQYRYAYAGGGNPQTDRSNLSVGTAGYDALGPEGSRAFYVKGDFTQIADAVPFPDYNYSGFGGGFGNFFMDWANNQALGLPSPNLAD